MCDSKKLLKPFDGSKYNIWRARIRALIDESIIEENALAVIDTPYRPNNISERKWLKYNKIAKGIIIKNLSDSVVGLATNNPSLSAGEIFKNLDDLYMRQSLATELSTEMKLLNFKYDTNMALTEHFMLFDELTTDLEAASGEKLKETNKIARLLKSLPQSYDSLVVAIQTLSDDKLSLAFVKVRLLEHEIHLKKQNNDTSLSVLQVAGVNSNYNNKVSRKNFKWSPKNIANKRMSIKCHYCNKAGHIKKNCYKYRNKQKYAKVNENINTAQMAEQCSGVVFMCDRNEIKDTNNLTFVIDSGASDHIINNEMWFESSELLQPPLKIAVAKNQTFIEATKRGQVKLLTDKNAVITLKDVLLCKDVPNNIISVKKMQEADLVIIFNKTKIAIKKNN